jgi:hypothetical protein
MSHFNGLWDARLHVSFAYDTLFRFRMLDGEKAGDTTQVLKLTIELFGTERHPELWRATPGNVGFMLSILYTWACAFPDAVWSIEHEYPLRGTHIDEDRR